MKRLLLLALAGLSACAHVREKGDLEDLKPTLEAFHQRLRWRDYRGAADFLVAERRTSFTRARLARNDDRDLSFTDYQLEDCDISKDVKTASCVSRMGWIRLPSPSEEQAVVTSVWTWDGYAWRLKSQDGGPFQPELAP